MPRQRVPRACIYSAWARAFEYAVCPPEYGFTVSVAEPVGGEGEEKKAAPSGSSEMEQNATKFALSAHRLHMCIPPYQMPGHLSRSLF